MNAMWNPDALEKPIVNLVQFLADFRTNHENGSDVKLADDSYTGPVWLDILKAARALLSTELGRLDGGLLDTIILEELEEAGFSESDL
tara:strand:- start:458 stop:721 length:264 start_codon:yes stop_codon:yes gene_type:complete